MVFQHVFTCLKLRMLRLPVLPGRADAVVQGLHARLQRSNVLGKWGNGEISRSQCENLVI